MDYRLNLGSWNKVFVVPGEIVDKHLKLAGAAQLKVLLWVLRHAGENFTVEDIASSLTMQPADVRDSMLYWTETGVICVNEGEITPSQPVYEEPEIPIRTEVTEKKEEISVTSDKKEKMKEEEPKEKKPARVLSAPVKPDMKYLTKRIDEDENIAFLMRTADEIFGRTTGTNEKATLLMILESFGLPVEVIIMLLRYTSEIGKCNVRYIEKVAINWADEEITTVPQAEEKIRLITSGRNAAVKIQSIIGVDKHSPTEREVSYAEKWINTWKFTDDMIRRAYEICMDAKSKYIPKYVDSILSRWQKSGITTIEQVDADQSSKGNKKEPVKSGYEATYDIAAYESRSVVDDDEED